MCVSFMEGVTTTNQPTNQPSNHPTNQPTNQPTNHPTNQPTTQPSSQANKNRPKPISRQGDPTNQPVDCKPSKLLQQMNQDTKPTKRSCRADSFLGPARDSLIHLSLSCGRTTCATASKPTVARLAPRSSLNLSCHVSSGTKRSSSERERALR